MAATIKEARAKAIAEIKDWGGAVVSVVVSIGPAGHPPLYVEFDADGEMLAGWKEGKTLWQEPGSQTEPGYIPGRGP